MLEGRLNRLCATPLFENLAEKNELKMIDKQRSISRNISPPIEIPVVSKPLGNVSFGSTTFENFKGFSKGGGTGRPKPAKRGRIML